MKTYPSIDKKTGHTFAFEIEHIYVSNSMIARILSRTSGVTDVRVRRLFTQWREIHIWFKYRGREFVVWEPYGDNSRYWVGPENENETSMCIEEIKISFEKYHPSIPVKIIGDLLSLNLRNIFNRK